MGGDDAQEVNLLLKKGMRIDVIGRDGCPSNEHTIKAGEAGEGFLARGAVMAKRCAKGGQCRGVKAEPLGFAVLEQQDAHGQAPRRPDQYPNGR
jgi:hypothetical protein